MTKTNHEYPENEQLFRALCKKFGVEPTAREANKFKVGAGELYKKVFLDKKRR